jgi:hypothetical protein
MVNLGSTGKSVRNKVLRKIFNGSLGEPYFRALVAIKKAPGENTCNKIGSPRFPRK